MVKLYWQCCQRMSALPPKADMVEHGCDVRFVPLSDICAAAKMTLFDHLVGTGKERRWNLEAERLRSLEVDRKLEFGRQHNW
jgi:hypothetical protein